MNLINGEIVDGRAAAAFMPSLPGHITRTLQKPPPAPMLVVEACEQLMRTLPDETVLPVLAKLGFSPAQAKQQLASLRLMFSREYLLRRLETELGSTDTQVGHRTPYGAKIAVDEQIYPLGVLFHIAAGNMDGLPVFTVIEGLLTGNINLLKLPQVDGGLSVRLLQQLVLLQPALAEYIYVFELSSKETDSLMQLARLADAVVVWGGDEAVHSVRSLAPPNTRVIEWGHKLSFAYVTERGMTQAKMERLAHHICSTNQLLCSSCQGIFVDTARAQTAQDFCRRFLPILDEAGAEYPPVPLSARAQSTLRLTSERLEAAFGKKSRVFGGARSSVIFEPDGALTASFQFRNPWVRCLPRDAIIENLHGYKNHLQTAALLCSSAEWQPLRDLLWRAGVVRVCGSAEMSESYCGMPHDGEYPLRRYTRVVSAQ